MNYYNISKTAEFLGVSAQTLRNWDKDCVLVPSYITDKGYRYYSESDISAFLKTTKTMPSFAVLVSKKVFRDPLYGNIPVELDIISKLIDTREVQRLRRIRQLSGVSMVFHTAEHSRFAHSLGTYYIAYRMITESEDIKNYLSDYEKGVLLISALLHDVGHGPYSHAFEHVFEVKHEEITCRMIEDENTEINKVLRTYPGLAHDVAGVISHRGEMPMVESLISSQLDVDRLDYLNRDANFTGATYGVVDVDRLIRVTRVKDGKICYRAAGSYAIENYLMSRYHMYWQIYYHPTARSYEIVLESIYARIKDLLLENVKIEADIDSLRKVFEEKDLESYIDLDDAYVNGMIKHFTKSSDPILNDLCNSFMNRKLFKYIYLRDDLESEESSKIKQDYLKNDILSKYYYKEDVVSQATYLTYMKTGNDINVNNILILLEDGTVKPLEEYSAIVRGLIQSGQKREKKIFYGTPSVEVIKNV